jgi:hypothetical protein
LIYYVYQSIQKGAGEMRSTEAASKTMRKDRARKVADEHAREIAESAVGAVYKVPGCTGAASYHVVSLSRGTCECGNSRQQGASCEHLLVAEIVNAKSATCADCNRRFLGRDLYEVTEDHESLTWFVGDLLCRSCAIGHGIV